MRYTTKKEPSNLCASVQYKRLQKDNALENKTEHWKDDSVAFLTLNCCYFLRAFHKMMYLWKCLSFVSSVPLKLLLYSQRNESMWKHSQHTLTVTYEDHMFVSFILAIFGLSSSQRNIVAFISIWMSYFLTMLVHCTVFLRRDVCHAFLYSILGLSQMVWTCSFLQILKSQ